MVPGVYRVDCAQKVASRPVHPQNFNSIGHERDCVHFDLMCDWSRLHNVMTHINSSARCWQVATCCNAWLLSRRGGYTVAWRIECTSKWSANWTCQYGSQACHLPLADEYLRNRSAGLQPVLLLVLLPMLEGGSHSYCFRSLHKIVRSAYHYWYLYFRVHNRKQALFAS